MDRLEQLKYEIDLLRECVFSGFPIVTNALELIYEELSRGRLENSASQTTYGLLAGRDLSK